MEQEPLWNKVSDQALLQLLLGNGSRYDTTVVLYGRSALVAARAAHLMLYAGVKDVRILDGGFAAWRRVASGQSRTPAPIPSGERFWRHLPRVPGGDIPGARWGRAGDGDDVYSMSDFHNPDGTIKFPDEICSFWRGSGIQSGQQIAFYCGSGWRASLAFFYAWLMNWERISVYDGGGFEWSLDPGNPVVCRA